MDTALTKHEAAVNKAKTAAAFGDDVVLDISEILDSMKENIIAGGTSDSREGRRIDRISGKAETLLTEFSECTGRFLEAEEEFTSVITILFYILLRNYLNLSRCRNISTLKWAS
jgi:hypothetical protein